MSGACPVFGFSVRMALRDGVESDVGDAIVDDLVRLLEANGLSMGGAGDREREFVVTRDGTQATDADRQLVQRWAERWKQDAAVRVTELVDLNADD
jgi:uncharacterized protein YggL (DUF469 family)